MVSNKLVIDSGLVDDRKYLMGPREDGVLYFNGSLIEIAGSMAPDRARLFLSIAKNNLCELISRFLTKVENPGEALIYTIRLLSQINVVTRSLAPLKIGEWREPEAFPFDPSNSELQSVIKLGEFPTLLSFRRADIEGMTMDGIRIIPITFLRDMGDSFESNNLDLWAEDEMEEFIDHMNRDRLRIVIAWINGGLDRAKIGSIRILMHELGIYPIFMNIDLLNAENSRRLERQFQIKDWEFVDYKDPKNLPRYIRMPARSFTEVLNFYAQMARDPDVESIYLTIYRVGEDSSLVGILAEAVANGKNVFVYVEPSARGDEFNNLSIARRFRDIGATVRMSYGGMKVHAKMGMVVFNDGRSIVHMATGNFNEKTATQYTDIHAISEDPEDVAQVQEAFLALGTGIPMRQKIKDIIINEIRRESSFGVDGRIMIKCNHAIDEDLKHELKMASQCGCSVKLITRTTLGIQPQEIGAEVETIVGDYLEHERIYGFGNGNSIRVYLSSSDLMFRNLYKRMEILFQVRDEKLAWQLMKENWYD